MGPDDAGPPDGDLELLGGYESAATNAPGHVVAAGPARWGKPLLLMPTADGYRTSNTMEDARRRRQTATDANTTASDATEAPLSVVQHGGGWITNVGNAFFDLGSMWAIRNAIDRDVKASLASSFSRWSTAKLKRGPISFLGADASSANAFHPAAHYDADYLVRSGACLSPEWLDRYGDALEAADRRGTKLIFHGIGFSDWSYDRREIEAVQEWMEAVEPYAIVSRDERTYDALRGIAEHTYDGIDCAFFLDEYYDPMPMTEDLVALNFDKRREPEVESDPADDRTIVRPHHSFWYPWKLTEYPSMVHQYYRRENVFVSDVPEEYLDVYAAASETHADRVHACVATLVFGSPARLHIDTPRSGLLDRVGHGAVTERLTEPEPSIIEQEKAAQLAFLREVL